ncbi:glutathione S-transferase [Luteimonas sp. SJ-92]|uniref:Glutathione S-transferase n=1 Tax=Luteimonas salinisoli TaxID=2752307 RepID=A0A853JEW1_9GAMM|nr:glutathione S-transferase [Luteimonas salinisoli]NZA27090.1 glutathione S-transferase [Luteimonas salinisoli]
MRYELYYWPGIPGRGEFVRLALEEGGADYIDVGNDEEAGGMAALEAVLEGDGAHPPFALPALKAGSVLVAQVAAILQYLGPRLGLAARDPRAALWTHQLQLTVADAVTEAHDVHHPLGAGSWYREQKPEAARRAREFREQRIPKFLGYFEQVLARNPKGPRWLVGARVSYADLSLFQLVAGLRYAFPRTMAGVEDDLPRLRDLAARVAERPRTARYLASPRRLPFNENGIFRHYPELDG